MKKNYTSSRCQEGWCLDVKCEKYYDTTLTMLERAMYLAIILLLVKCRFENHWSDDKYGQ